MKYKLVLLSLSICVLNTTLLFAQKPMSNEWDFKLAPYLWTVQLDVENTVGRITVPIDVSFGDIWNNLRFAGSLHYEMSKNEWSIIADFAYIDIYRENIPVETPGPGSPVGNMDFTIWQGELLGTYRIGEPADISYFEFLAGMRYTRQKLDVVLDLLIEITPEGGFDESWIDPILGGRYIATFSPEWVGHIRADVGGFSVGSTITYNVAGQLGYKFSDLFALILGYRYLYVNYESGTGGSQDYFGYKGDQHGIVLGGMFTW